jgi:hypothetical protein
MGGLFFTTDVWTGGGVTDDASLSSKKTNLGQTVKTEMSYNWFILKYHLSFDFNVL